MVGIDQVLEKLSTVIDPDLKKDIVSMGMIKDLELNQGDLKFTLQLLLIMSSRGSPIAHDSSVATNILANALRTAQLTDSFLNDSDNNIDERFLYLERSIASMQNETYSYTSEIKNLKIQIESLEKELY